MNHTKIFWFPDREVAQKSLFDIPIHWVRKAKLLSEQDEVVGF